MEAVQLQMNDNGRGAFVIKEGDKQLAEMDIAVSGEKLTAFHTEVASEAEGKGLAKQLLNAMVAYAREHKLQVRALCSFVFTQFERNADTYNDIWLRD